MSVRKLTLTLLASASLFLIQAGPVFAHVTVKPGEVGIGQTEIFSVHVPTEKDNPTIGLRLVIPAGLSSVKPFVKAGWQVQLQKNEAGNITEIVWSGGEIPTDMKDIFEFSARADEGIETLIWKAYQTYQDGSIISWDQEPGSGAEHGDESTPYSQTLVQTTSAPSTSELQQSIDKITNQQRNSGGLSTFVLVLTVVNFFLAVTAIARKDKVTIG